jgi:hypothetical protein
VPEADYSFWSRAFHRLALGNRFAAELSFDIEKLMYPPGDRDIGREPHVFIAGLARAGTTILMRELYATGKYRSLTYRDMPFPLAPNLWSRISQLSQANKGPAERAHGDGILVDFDSPEALEEVYWRVHCGSDYIRGDRLVPMSASADIIADFRDYVSLLLKGHDEKFYLSKNNNNILRLETITRCLPATIVIIPFRDPTQHASSLMRQHQLFRSRHSDDDFSLAYMRWLVHHEFGQDHRPFVFSEADSNALKACDPDTDHEYWLRLWIVTYRQLLESAPVNCVFLSYERLCNDTQTVWPLLCERLGLPAQSLPQSLRQAQHDIEDAASDSLHEARELYSGLSERGL